jgi:tetratricopeptide (TPR) repeat protein
VGSDQDDVSVGVGTTTRERPGVRTNGLGSLRFSAGWRPALVLLSLVVAAYLPALRAGYVWDDDSYLTANPNLVDLHGLARIWLSPSASPQYYPLVFTSFWIERHLWGPAPFGYHLVNVLLHAIAAILVRQVLRPLGLVASWGAAVLFALHPVQVESVAWVTERKNVLSAVFYLAAALAYLRLAAARSRGTRTRGLPAVVLLFLAALLSKTVTATLPVALAIVLWWRDGSLSRRDGVSLGLLLVPAAALASHTVWLERTHVGAEGESWALSAPERLLVAGRAFWFYAAHVAWPAGLSFVYPRWSLDAADPRQWLFPAAALAIAATLWAARHRWGRGPLAAFLYFAVTLLPVLGFFDVYPFRFSFVADHFQYLASLGPFALIAGGAARLRERGGPAGRRVVVAAGAAVIVLCGLATFGRSRAYTDEETLWNDTLARNPTAWMAHTNLAVYLDGRGRYDEAVAHHREAIRLRPDLAGSRNNLGVTLEKTGRTDEAIAAYLAALQIEPANADYGRNLANLLARLGRFAQAEACYHEVLRLRPDDRASANNLAYVLIREGKVDEAERILRELLRRDPNQARAWANLAEALKASGREVEGEEALRRALAVDPGLTTDPRAGP